MEGQYSIMKEDKIQKVLILSMKEDEIQKVLIPYKVSNC